MQCKKIFYNYKKREDKSYIYLLLSLTAVKIYIKNDNK